MGADPQGDAGRAASPAAEDHYDLDQVYEWAGGEPDPVHVSALADVVDMVAKIADCCDDGALRRLVEGTPAYAELVDEDVSYQGKDGRKRWNELGDTIADSWERAIKRVDDWLEWVGDFTESEFDDEDSVWDRVGAEPIEHPHRRRHLPDGARRRPRRRRGRRQLETAFLGEPDENVAVFTEVADLARYCREAKGHRLVKLEWWSELADASRTTTTSSPPRTPSTTCASRPSRRRRAACASSPSSATSTPTPTCWTARASTATTGATLRRRGRRPASQVED